MDVISFVPSKPLPWSWKHTKQRKMPDDPLFFDGDLLCQQAHKHIRLELEEETENRIVDEFVCHISGCGKIFNTIADFEVHYNANHRNRCSQCKRTFPTNHLLELHILEWHDALFLLQAAKQNMYQCLVVTCTEKFASAKERRNHLIKVHRYPANFRFDHHKKERKERKINDAMEIETSSTEASEQRLSNPPSTASMETDDTSKSTRRFAYRVPNVISFGQGVGRGFQRPPSSKKKHGKKKRHWHQQGNEMDTSVNIEEVDMKELETALDKH